MIVPESDSATDARIAERERQLTESQRDNEILKAASPFSRRNSTPTTAMPAFVDASHEQFEVEELRHLTRFPVSTYYATKQREKTTRRTGRGGLLSWPSSSAPNGRTAVACTGLVRSGTTCAAGPDARSNGSGGLAG
ncbi:hypothetical protein FHX42_001518 [Saccharopolyspora lacisalsi]|uniref:Uncharacterized protein n=1 Tax=Halosaccharopolyspora lacisalsi TaxID=1000566 RepID=A0A839DTV3_9PSEU|nr:hypothetical protein [Halosaccharopolyspora lacisalsi]MBA8824189.1 hypothetical protein [Halosaccharopolyspora lacisalsi]